jgi:hypothetical protein
LDFLELDTLYEKFTGLLSKITWFPTALGVTIVAFLVVLGFIIINKVQKGGQELNIFGVLNLKPNAEFANLQEQFTNLNEYDRLKANVLKLLNQTYLTLPMLESDKANQIKLEQHLSLFYDFFLPGILSLISRGRDNQHRIAVFLQENQKLKILRGNGYSLDGLKYLKLNVLNSKAGNAFLNSTPYFNNNLTLDPSYVRNPKSSKEYKSLICIPIEYNGKVLGILNIDGLKENSFDKDDVDYLTYFANALAPILKLQMDHTVVNIFEEEDVNVG